MSSPSLHSSDKEKGTEIQNEYVGKALDAPYLSPVEEKKLMRKIDYKVPPASHCCSLESSDTLWCRLSRPSRFKLPSPLLLTPPPRPGFRIRLSSSSPSSRCSTYSVFWIE